MGDAHGAVRGVDRLATRPAGAKHVDAQILLVDSHVHIFGFRQHGHRRRRRMNTPLGFGLRYALHAVHAGLIFHAREHTLAGDIGDDFLVAARRAFACRNDVDLPAVTIGETLIHAVEIPGEQGRLVAPRTGAHFQNRALIVRIILRQELNLKLAFERFDLLGERADLFLCERDHVRIGAVVENLLQTLLFGLRLTQRIDRAHNGIEVRIFLGQLRIALRVGARGEFALNGLPTGNELVEFLNGNRGHGLRKRGLRNYSAAGRPCGYAGRRDREPGPTY